MMQGQNHWHSADTHCHDWAGSVSLSIWSMKAANTSSMHQNGQVSNQLPDLQDQKSLTLCWRSFSESGRERIAFSCAYKGSLYVVDECLWPLSMESNRDARPNIVGTPWTLIVMTGLGVCHFLFGLSTQPILSVCIKIANSQINYPTCKTKNCGRSVDAHFQNGAGTVSLSLLHINSAYSSFINLWIQLPLRLPRIQHQKSLGRHGLPFLRWGRERVSLVFDYKRSQYIKKGQQHTNVNILQLAVWYLNATINRKTRKPAPEIGTDGCSQTWQNQQVDWFGSGYGLPRCGRLGLWTGFELNQNFSAVWTRTPGGFPRLVGTRSDAKCDSNLVQLIPSYCYESNSVVCEVVQEQSFPEQQSFKSGMIVPDWPQPHLWTITGSEVQE